MSAQQQQLLLEQSAASHIFSYLSDKEVGTYLASQSFSKRQLARLMKKATDASVLDAIAKELLQQSPTFVQLCSIINRSTLYFSEAVEQITTRFPKPKPKQLERLVAFFTPFMLFGNLAQLKSGADVKSLARYILTSTDDPDFLIVLYDVVSELDDAILESLQGCGRSIEPDQLRLALLHPFSSQEAQRKLGRVIASMPNLPQDVVAILASYLYGVEDCWERFRGYPNLTSKDFRALLFPQGYGDLPSKVEPCTSPPEYLDKVLQHFYRLQPHCADLAILLFRYPSHSEAIARQLIARMPNEYLLRRIFKEQGAMLLRRWFNEHRLPASVCDLLGEYAMQTFDNLSNELLCDITAFAPSVADEAYIKLLTRSPSESDFEYLVSLNGNKKKEAAILLLERYPTEDNAVFVTESIPELALFALKHIKHSASKVLSSPPERVFLPVCEEFY